MGSNPDELVLHTVELHLVTHVLKHGYASQDRPVRGSHRTRSQAIGAFQVPDSNGNHGCIAVAGCRLSILDRMLDRTYDASISYLLDDGNPWTIGRGSPEPLRCLVEKRNSALGIGDQHGVVHKREGSVRHLLGTLKFQPLGLSQLFQLLSHLVKCRSQLSQLVRAALGNAVREVSLTDQFRLSGHTSQGIQSQANDDVG